MELIRPPCGDNLTAHPAHHVWHGDVACPGWSPANADACSLVKCFLALAANFGQREPGVPVATLECHPSVPHSLIKVAIPGYREFVSGQAGPVPLEVAVVVDAAMPAGAWRLTVASGIIGDEAIPQESGIKKEGES